MQDAVMLSVQALTLYVIAAGLFGLGAWTPMDPADSRIVADLIGTLFILASLLFLLSLARAAAG